jgi:ribosomal protein S27E
VLFGYGFIVCPFLLICGLFQRFTSDDHLDCLSELVESGDYPANRSRDNVYQLLSRYWPSYKLRHSASLRSVEVREVEKMLNCKDHYFLFECPSCEDKKIVYSTCNSRVCTCCGKKHTDKWSKQLCKRLIKKRHRHIVLTVPDVLWPYFREHRDLLKQLMDCSREMFNYVLKETKHGDLTPAYLAVLHSFGRDMKWNCHVHLIFASGGFTREKKWVDISYISYKLMHMAWQNSVLEMLKKKLTPFHPEMPSLVDSLYKKYPKGFYVNVKDTIERNNITVSYVGRYIKHPAIASSRIISYDDDEVSFYYKDHKTGKKIYKTMPTDDFITSLIGHIPDNQFKVVRYYGAYSRKSYKTFRRIMGVVESITQLSLPHFSIIPEKWAPTCEKCKVKMKCIWYSGKGPPLEWKHGERLSEWVEALGTG